MFACYTAFLAQTARSGSWEGSQGLGVDGGTLAVFKAGSALPVGSPKCSNS